ncbi:MAG: hypothetical protein GY789_16580 [Hyphomicrobiales bacterium]|nr:hypothetical protein [Hyphomicrobiales bacterium]MCP5000460.1 hypothetical protein [Hyphomicrobiales bacterium]
MSRTDKPIDYPLLFEGQLAHGLCLVALLALSIWLAGFQGVLDGSLFGISTQIWLILLIGDTIVHQLIVLIAWRLELHGGKLTQWFGDTERAFQTYAVIFAILFAARFVLVTLLAIANRGTLNIEPWIGYVLAAAIAVPSAYLFYSVNTFFSFRRAFGVDHFDTDARNWPMIREGIFKYTSNGMYVFGIGTLWIPALAMQSSAALLGAAFSHAYIWVHYFTVEKPDMRHIYGAAPSGGKAP